MTITTNRTDIRIAVRKALEEFNEEYIHNYTRFQMDKKIKKMTKDTKKVVKEEKSLLKADQKRDKMCEMGKKEMMKKKK